METILLFLVGWGLAFGFWSLVEYLWRRRLRILSWWLWHRQGCPTDEPVVIKQGLVATCPHGHGLISRFTWDASHMPRGTAVDVDHLFDRYTARYEVQRVDCIDGCPKCRR